MMRPPEQGRLERRLTLLRAKRQGCFDPDQRYQDSAIRARLARKVRTSMRRQEPLFLLTPRWSRPDRFLDELACDLLVGRPLVTARVVPLGTTHGRATHEAQSYLLRCVAESADLDSEGAASQPIRRDGFRAILLGLLRRTVGGPRRALLLQGVEHLDIGIVEDLYSCLLEHAESCGANRRYNMLFSGSVPLSRGRFPGLHTHILPDFGPDEAVQAVYEYLDRPHELDAERDAELAAALVGGVPALLHAVGVAADESRGLPTRQETVWSSLGPLGDEIRAAVDIVASDQELAERLEAIAKQGSMPIDVSLDRKLIRAGLVRGVPKARRPRVVVRAPIIAQLAGMVIGQSQEEEFITPTVEAD